MGRQWSRIDVVLFNTTVRRPPLHLPFGQTLDDVEKCWSSQLQRVPDRLSLSVYWVSADG